MSWIKKIKLNLFAFRRVLGKEKNILLEESNRPEIKYLLFENVELVNSNIGDYSYVSKNSIVHNCTIGRFSSIGPNVVIGYGDHPIEFLSTSPLFYAAENGMFGEHLFTKNTFQYKDKVVIGNDVWIGANVYIKNGVVIGDGAVVGAGAVVTKDVAPYSIVVGVPAKFIKYRFPQNEIVALLDLKWWNWSIDKIKRNKSDFVNPLNNEVLLKFKKIEHE